MNSNHSNTEHPNRLMRLKEVIHTSGWRSQGIQNWIQERGERLAIQVVEKEKRKKRYGR
ncbi:hypothetical protein [Vibrio sp. 10N.261.51.A4]|uniref:hypothetical protein n=1 Tax=Vibrio sp. 10N.261.51.A4 TaxID=3229674 RepID=UPI00354EDA49